jgi:hypothetical protein
MKSVKEKREDKRLIITLMGGLGNQLFQFTFGRFLQHIHGCELLFDISHKSLRTDSNGYPDIYEMGIIDKEQLLVPPYHFMREKLRNLGIRSSTRNDFASLIQREFTRHTLSAFFSHNFWRFEEPPLIFIANDIGFSPYNFKVSNRDEYVLGYFQTYRYFENLMLNDSKTRSEFLNFVELGRNKWQHLSPGNSVIVHVRRKDYKETPFGLLSNNYYLDALTQASDLSNQGRVFAISDEELSDLKEFLKPISNQIEIIDTKEMSSADILSLISSFKFIVGANSTLSWWAASLGGLVENNMVWFPDPWFKSGRTPRHLFARNWNLVTGNLWE